MLQPSFVQQINKVFANVKDFSNGINNDVAVQATVNAVAATPSGGIVYVPHATYNWLNTVTIPASGKVTLMGDGAGATIFQTPAGSEALPMLIVGDNVSTCSDVSIIGIQFSSANQKTANAAIKLQKCFRTHIRDIRTQNQFRGIHVFNSTETWLDDSDLRDSSENGLVFESTLGNGNDCYLTNVTMDNPVVLGANNGSGILWLGGENLVTQNVDIIHFQQGLLIAPPSGQQCRWGFFNTGEFDTSFNNNIAIAPSGNGNVVAMTFVNCWTGTATNYGVLVDNSGGSGLLQGVRFSNHKSLHNGLAGIRMTGGAQDVHISSSDVIANSQTSSNTRSGIEVSSTMGSDWSIVDCRCGNGWQQGSTQQYGISTDAANYTNVEIANNDVTNNATGGINLNNPTTFTNGQVTGNRGHNPKGNFTAPGVPASGTPLVNNTGYDCTVIVTANAGGTTAVAIGGVATGITIAASGIAQFRLPANQSITYTYVSAPTHAWWAD